MKESTEKNTPASHRPGPLPLLLVLVALFAVGLAVLKALDPGANVIAWSWIAYGIGGIIIFFVLSQRSKRKKPQITDTGNDEGANHSGEGSVSLDEVRDRIRQRKREKGRRIKE